jgi:hypothetical protein
MLLWTVMPLDLVLNGVENVIAYEELDYAGVKVQVEKLSPLECRIVRILSTQPEDYLRPELQPGSTLIYKPTQTAI